MPSVRTPYPKPVSSTPPPITADDVRALFADHGKKLKVLCDTYCAEGALMFNLLRKSAHEVEMPSPYAALMPLTRKYRRAAAPHLAACEEWARGDYIDLVGDAIYAKLVLSFMCIDEVLGLDADFNQKVKPWHKAARYIDAFICRAWTAPRREPPKLHLTAPRIQFVTAALDLIGYRNDDGERYSDEGVYDVLRRRRGAELIHPPLRRA